MSAPNLGPAGEPLFADQWYLDNTGQDGGTPGADIDVLGAWDTGVTGAGVTVVVDDTGIDYTNPDIARTTTPAPRRASIRRPMTVIHTMTSAWSAARRWTSRTAPG